MTVNISKLNNGDVLIVETEKSDECYEIVILDNLNSIVQIYERLKYPDKKVCKLSDNLEEINGKLCKGKCMVFSINGQIKITDVIKGVTLISTKGFTYDIYPDVERQEKMKLSLKNAINRFVKINEEREYPDVKLYKPDDDGDTNENIV